LQKKNPEEIRAILSILALSACARVHARFLLDYSADELLEMERQASEVEPQLRVILGDNVNSVPDKRGGFDRSMQHHLVKSLFKDGVYDPRKTVETFSHAEN
jgi:hypothetical protein